LALELLVLPRCRDVTEHIHIAFRKPIRFGATIGSSDSWPQFVEPKRRRRTDGERQRNNEEGAEREICGVVVFRERDSLNRFGRKPLRWRQEKRRAGDDPKQSAKS
jgi:hypothetical protein